MSQELTPDQQAKVEQMYPFWRFHLWTKNVGSYNQIDAKVRRGELRPLLCPDEECDCKWPKPSQADT